MGAVPLLTREGEVNLARRMWQGKLARSIVEFSLAIRAIPWYPSKWKTFTKEIEHLAEEIAHLEAETRRLDDRSNPAIAIASALLQNGQAQSAQARIREL